MSVKSLKQSEFHSPHWLSEKCLGRFRCYPPCFYSSAKGKSPHLSGQPQNPLLVQLVQECVWTQRGLLTVQSGPCEDNWAILPTKEGGVKMPFPGEYLWTHDDN